MPFRTLHPRLLLLLLLLMATSSTVRAEMRAGTSAGTTHIAVAANFAAPMRAIVQLFEQRSGHTVALSIGSSGKLYAQISSGAPFDAFLSADTDKPARLIENGLAIADSRFTYAIGALALWRGDNSNDKTRGEDARTLLQTERYRKLAIANPRLAPYGVAAMEVLRQLGVLEYAQPRLITGENIAQAYHFVATGNADLGFVALSQIIENRGIEHGQLPAGAWLVPASLHQPIRQDAVLLKRGGDNEAARQLLQFLRGEDAARIIGDFGYRLDTSSP